MVGQEKLINKLMSYSINTLPQTILLVGENGCGKHLLTSELSHHFNLGCEDITENISLDYIREIYKYPLPKFYVINASVLTDRQQNIILKLLEEPVKNSFLILLCENKATLLNTILNRCVVFEFEPYSPNELKEFIQSKDDEEFLLSMCHTPGQLINVNPKTLKDTDELCETIVKKIGVANYANTLSIVNKINYKDSYDKIDLNIFLNVLGIKLLNEYKETNSDVCIKMYDVLNQGKKSLRDSRLNKEYFMEHLLTSLWRVSRECQQN